ncbi:MAG: hypothetical protein ABF969_12035 [Sporolactobacillus sp.]
MKNGLDEMIKMFDTAKSQPSNHCTDGGDHEFEAVMHTDNEDSYSWYFKCAKCGEYVKKTEKRKGRNMEQWSD